MAAPRIAPCPSRERLLADYRRKLAQNNSTFSGLLDSHTVEEAAKLTLELFKACVAAREALKHHEHEHGCKPV